MTLVLEPPSVERMIQFSLRRVEGEAKFRLSYRNDCNRMSGHSKKRPIRIPNSSMRQLQSDFRDYLRALPVDYTYATAYREGCNVKANVARHRHNRFFYLLDLEGAFDQVDGIELAGILARLVGKMRMSALEMLGKKEEQLDLLISQSEEEKVFEFLNTYCLLEGGKGLPQGGPASQDLFNIYMAELVDKKIALYCNKHRLTYTRYGDDLTFSSRHAIGKVVRRKLREVLLSQGMKLSHHKCELVDIARVGGRSVLLNGVRLKWGGKMFAPKSFVRQAHLLVYAAQRTPDEKLYFRAQGLAACVFYIARGRDLTQAEAKLAYDLRDLRYSKKADMPAFAVGCR